MAEIGVGPFIYSNEQESHHVGKQMVYRMDTNHAGLMSLGMICVPHRNGHLRTVIKPTRKLNATTNRVLHVAEMAEIGVGRLFCSY